MSLISKEVIIDNKRFEVKFDPDAMRREALEYDDVDDDWIITEGLNLGDPYDHAKRPTVEQLSECVKKMLKDITDLVEDPAALESLVRGIGKKKDGFCKKGGINHYAWYPETGWCSEEEYGYRMLCIKAKAQDAQIINVRLETDIQKW